MLRLARLLVTTVESLLSSAGPSLSVPLRVVTPLADVISSAHPTPDLAVVAHALAEGFEAVVLEDATRAISADGWRAAKQELLDLGALVQTSHAGLREP